MPTATSQHRSGLSLSRRSKFTVKPRILSSAETRVVVDSIGVSRGDTSASAAKKVTFQGCSRRDFFFYHGVKGVFDCFPRGSSRQNLCQLQKGNQRIDVEFEQGRLPTHKLLFACHRFSMRRLLRLSRHVEDSERGRKFPKTIYVP